MAAKIEKTLVLLKPDAVRRGLIGTIISRFEAAGLKIVALKMIAADKSRIDLHYPINDQDFMTSLGQRGLSNCREAGLDPMTIFGSDDVYRIGQHIQELNSRFLSAGPIVAIVISGPNAIMVVRKLRGSTIPAMADPGTIIGDYSFDSAELAAAQGRSIMNLAHASANPEEASSEIKLWFEAAEIFTYPMPIQDYMIGPS